MDIFIRNKRYTGPVQGIVLDWAGTAVDYGCLGPAAVFVDVFKKYGVGVTYGEAREFMGLAKKDHVRGMCNNPSVAAKWEAAHGRKPNEDDVDAMYLDTEPMMVASIVNHCELIPGLLESMQAVRSMGIKIGSCTGYTGPMMDVMRPEAAGRGYEPDATFCSSDVPAGRPYPWMCYANATALGIYPMEAMVKVGDTVSDIEEGLNAGMWTVGLTRSGNELGLSLKETENMPADELAARLAEIEGRYRAAGAHFIAEDITSLPTILELVNDRLSQGELPVPAGA